MPHAFNISEANNEKAIQALMSAPDGYVVTFTRKMTLTDGSVRERAMVLIRKLKAGWKMSLAQRNRTKEQNDKMWAMLTDLSIAQPMGKKKTPEQWKHLALHMCKHQCQFEMDLNGQPFAVGMSTSKLKVGEMADLITWIYAFGNENGVQWSEPVPDEYKQAA